MLNTTQAKRPPGCVEDTRYSRFCIAMGLMVGVLTGYPLSSLGIFAFSLISIYLAMTAITRRDPCTAAAERFHCFKIKRSLETNLVPYRFEPAVLTTNLLRPPQVH